MLKNPFYQSNQQGPDPAVIKNPGRDIGCELIGTSIKGDGAGVVCSYFDARWWKPIFAVAVIVLWFQLVSGQQTSSAQPPQQTVAPPPTNSSQQPGAPRPSLSPTTTQSVPPVVAGQSPGQTSTTLSLEEAVRLASIQASAFQQAGLNERIAAEDVRQARTAFLPRINGVADYIYTTPAIGLSAGEPRVQSFIANNAISEYQALASVGGDIDISGRLRATLRRNRALLEAARAGTEVARRELKQATIETYFGLSLAAARRSSAEQNLAAAEEFQRVTSLLFSAGEIASVDKTRAQLQVTQRRDELEQSRAAELIAADALRVLIGYDFTRPLVVTDLSTTSPADVEIERITADTVTRRPEFAQFEAQRRAAELDVKIARAERRPQLSYTINGGFDTDTLRGPRFKEHTGAAGTFNLIIPIFDFGASQSRERQARLRAEITESQRLIATRGFYQQFHAASTTAISAAARISLAGNAVVLAINNLSASTARYRAGEASILEVTDAQTALATQRLALYQAQFDYEVARTRLLQAAGL